MFSIVIPLYNKEDFIVRAIESAINQTVQDFEIIIVDDGSTDASVERVRELESDRVHLVQQPNAGPGAARNRGVQESRYDYIAFLDADDVFLPNHLEEIQEIIRRFPHAALVSTRSSEMQNSLYQAGSFPRPGALKNTTYRKYNYFREWRPRCGYIWTSCIVVNKQVFVRSGGFNSISPGEDLDLWIRLALDHDFAISTRMSALYMRGTGGIMETNEKRNREGKAPEVRSKNTPLRETLQEARRNARYKAKWQDIDRYLHQWSMIKFRMLLVGGDIPGAREIFGEVNAPSLFDVIFWRMVLMFPDRLVSPSVRIGISGKRFFSKFS